VWHVDEYVSHASFEDVFEPLERVTFSTRGGWDIEDHGIAQDAPRDWRRAYREFRPVSAIAARIAALKGDLTPYIAVHVRRTDMRPLASRLGVELRGDDVVEAWIRKHAKGRPVYLATDNGETQARYLALGGVHIGASLTGRETQDEADHHRNGTLADAVVDLFTCAGAMRFLGSGFGSFSATIEILRGLK
jgi:hypothetical protein